MKKPILLAFFTLLILSGFDQNQAVSQDKSEKCYTIIAPPENAPILLNQCTGETWTFRGSISVDGTNNKYWWHPIQKKTYDVE